MPAPAMPCMPSAEPARFDPGRLLAWAGPVFGPLLLFAPILLRGEATFWGAPMLQFTPWRAAALRILRSGHWPLWNPWLGMGSPLLANYQSALLYPPNWLLLVLDLGWGQTLLVMLHLIWGGAGMLCLARRLGLNRLGQGVASTSFALSGYLVARAGFLSMNGAASWLPWVLWAVGGMIGDSQPSRPRRRTFLIVCGLLALQWLAGHAQLAWYTALLAGSWAAWRGAQSRGARGALSGAGAFLAACALAFLLAAAQLLPTLEYLSQSVRSSGLEQGFAFTYSLWPWRLLGLLAPDLFGNPAQGNFWGYANYWEDALYLGVLPLLLAAAGLITPGRHRGLARFLAAAASLSLLLALGDRLPLFPFLFRHVPTFDLFQAPTRWTLILTAALSLLAGVGADRWTAPRARATYWLRLGTVGAGTVVLAAWLGPRVIPGLEPTLAPAVGLAGVLLALSGGLALRRPASPSLVWDAAAMGLVLADLVIAGARLNPSVPLSLQRGQSGLASSVTNAHRLYMAPDLEQALKFERHFRFDSFQPGHDWALVRRAGLPNTTVLDGLASANNFDPLVSGRYSAFLEALESATPARRGQLLDLMDVGWEAIADPGDPAGVRYAQRADARRVRWVASARPVSSPEQALSLLLEARHDPWTTVLLEGGEATEAGPPGGSGDVRLVAQDEAGRAELRVSATAAGWVVLHESWYPGWRAELDGRPVPIYPADGVFRAVQVPAGEHRLVFRYAPRTFVAGGLISLVAWAGVLARPAVARIRRGLGDA